MRLQGLEGRHLDEVCLAEGAVRDDEEVTSSLERRVAVHHIRRYLNALAGLGDDFGLAAVEIFKSPADLALDGPDLLAPNFLVFIGADSARRNAADHIDAQATNVLLVVADLRLLPLEELAVDVVELLIEEKDELSAGFARPDPNHFYFLHILDSIV